MIFWKGLTESSPNLLSDLQNIKNSQSYSHLNSDRFRKIPLKSGILVGFSKEFPKLQCNFENSLLNWECQKISTNFFFITRKNIFRVTFFSKLFYFRKLHIHSYSISYRTLSNSSWSLRTSNLNTLGKKKVTFFSKSVP